MDPTGLALEHFDGAGAYRATEQGADLDTSGVLDGKAFSDAAGLAQVLHDHPALPACLVKRVYAYATGGPVVPPTDGKILDFFVLQFAASGYRLPDLLRDIALSNAFLDVRQPRLAGTVVNAADAAAADTGARPAAVTRRPIDTEQR
jgi:hypothetical protein